MRIGARHTDENIPSVSFLNPPNRSPTPSPRSGAHLNRHGRTNGTFDWFAIQSFVGSSSRAMYRCFHSAQNRRQARSGVGVFKCLTFGVVGSSGLESLHAESLELEIRQSRIQRRQTVHRWGRARPCYWGALEVRLGSVGLGELAAIASD
jgi:hypothetical protein